MLTTVPDVSIIESLHPDDEGNGRFEGSSISHVLRLHGKNPRYRYVRTREEFQGAVEEFGSSNYRYLHISAHAEAEGMCTTNLDEIDYDELAEILKPHLRNRRLFLSACSMVHDDMAAEIIPKTKCYSVIGPREDITFTAAAVFWPSVYHLMFSHNNESMKREELKRYLKKVTELFEIDIGFYSKALGKKGYSKDLLKAKKS
jgi:hypothetical protein